MPDDIARLEEYQLKRRFQPLRFRDVRLNTSRPYLVKGLIPREGLTVAWGPPKCGKSFWVFDLMLHVTLGWEYRGRRVQPGTVCYVACEGERGLGARSEAFRKTKLSEDADPPFFLLTTRLDLVTDVDELIADIRLALGSDPCAAIVIDTLNRSIAGSESRDEDMSAYVKAADRLREAFKAAVVIIHHCGINGERPRGHTSLTGAADAQIAVKRDAADNIIATVEHMKDGPEGDEIASRLEVVDVGFDEDCAPITSCVVEPAEKSAPRRERLSGQLATALQLLKNALADAGERPPDTTKFPGARAVVPLSTWRSYCLRGGLAEGDNDEAFKKAWARVRNGLTNAGFTRVWDKLVWIVDPEGDKGT